MIDQSLHEIFSSGIYLMLIGLVAASLFFAMAGFRELSSRALEGLLFLALAVFFFCLHLFLLFNHQAHGELIPDTWHWCISILAPVLIGMYLLMGLVSFVSSHVRPGLVKIFFGLTLLCYLYMLGTGWSVDTKTILTAWYGGIWFNLELRTS